MLHTVSAGLGGERQEGELGRSAGRIGQKTGGKKSRRSLWHMACLPPW